MANRDSSIRALAKKLGKDYRVTVIDLEPVVYRDFGNGFNVEISGMYTTSKLRKATIYLWHGDRQPDCIIVKTVKGVSRDDISAVVEELYGYSEELIRSGQDNRDSIFTHRFRTWNIAKGGNVVTRKIFYGATPKFTDSDRRNFDRENYRCKALMQDKKGRPVVISQSMDKDLPVWKVEFGFSCIFFGSYEEALSCCKGRFPDNGRRAV